MFHIYHYLWCGRILQHPVVPRQRNTICSTTRCTHINWMDIADPLTRETLGRKALVEVSFLGYICTCSPFLVCFALAEEFCCSMVWKHGKFPSDYDFHCSRFARAGRTNICFNLCYRCLIGAFSVSFCARGNAWKLNYI